MRRPAVLALLAGLLLVLPTTGLASTPDEATVRVPAGADWVAVELTLAPEDWTRDGDGWSLAVEGGIEGVPADAWTSLDLVWVMEDGWTFGYAPFIWRGPFSISTMVWTSAAPGAERVVLIASAETTATWTTFLRVSDEGHGSTPSLLGSGTGASAFRYDSRTDAAPEGVSITTAPRASPAGAAGLATVATLEVDHPVSAPALHYAVGRVMFDASAGHFSGAGSLDDERSAHAEDVVGMGSRAFGVVGPVEHEADLSLAFESVSASQVSFGLDLAHVPFDAAAHGIDIGGGWIQGSGGLTTRLPCVLVAGETRCVTKAVL